MLNDEEQGSIEEFIKHAQARAARKRGQTVSVFRAVTGRTNYIDDQWIHSGVSEMQLIQDGIFASNQSLAQEDLLRSNLFDRRVPGLPVFLTKEEAMSFCEGKKYQQPPAIVEAKIPLRDLTGQKPKVKLIKNGTDPELDHQLTPAEIRDHLKKGSSQGEHYLQGVDTVLLPIGTFKNHESFYRPTLNPEGRIQPELGFREVDFLNRGEGRPGGEKE